MKKPVLLVMAAGMGSRYGGLKQIDKMTDEGEIIIDFSLYDAMKAGFEEVVFVIRKENKEDFDNILKDGAGKYLDIKYAYQELEDIPCGYEVPYNRQKPWGTGHAILSARDLIGGNFAVINGDDFYGREAFQKIYDFLSSNKDEKSFAMIAYELGKTISNQGSVSRGVCSVEDGYLKNIIERTEICRVNEGIAYKEGERWIDVSPNTQVSMNLWGYSNLMMRELEKRFPEFLDVAIKENSEKKEFVIPEVTDGLIKSGEARCKVIPTNSQWYGVTYREDRDEVRKALLEMKLEGVYPQKLFR